jgi:flagellar hook-associated protein 1 FlgK
MSLGLFATIGMSARSLEAQQAGIEVAGNNIANVNNPAYARQELNLATTTSVDTGAGLEGTGVQAVSVQQIRSALLDRQITTEQSSSGYLSSQQSALGFAQAALGEQIDSTTSTASGSSGSIAQGLSDLLNEFQNLSTQPTSMAERQVLLQKASALAGQFNQVQQRLDSLNTNLNSSVQSDVGNANQILSSIADLNDQITTAQINTGSTPNNLIDLRQQKIEQLGNLVNFTTAAQPDGAVNITVGGVLMVSGKNISDTLQAYDAGGGQMLVRATTAGTPLTLTGGTIAGSIDVRDGAVKTLSTSLDTLASQLIDQVNTIHDSGFSLTGSSNQPFFTGTDARTIAVNTTLLNNPALIQASGVSGVTGDNTVALALGQLANVPQAGLSNQTFSQSYDQTVSALGQSLSTVNGQVTDEQTVQQMLQQQRSSVSGVSLDEEMTNLSTYQRAYQASAHLLNIVDAMLDTLINGTT